MPKESTKATITSFAGTPLVRVVDGSNSRNISPANLVAESGAQTALDGRYAPLQDTGWRGVTVWNSAGSVTTGSLPSGVTATAATAGYIAFRRFGSLVSLRLEGATLGASPTIPVPTGFSPTPAFVKVTFVSPAGTSVVATVGGSVFLPSSLGATPVTYGVQIDWEVYDAAMPDPYPGIAITA